MRGFTTTTVTLEMTDKEAKALAALCYVAHDYLGGEDENSGMVRPVASRAITLARDLKAAARIGVFDLQAVLEDLLPAFRGASISIDAIRNRIEGARPVDFNPQNHDSPNDPAGL